MIDSINLKRNCKITHIPTSQNFVIGQMKNTNLKSKIKKQHKVSKQIKHENFKNKYFEFEAIT